MTENQWRTIFVVAASVIGYLLVQEDVVIDGWAKVALAATSVALAALSPSRLAER